ncbi:hypothetical protein ABK040_016700 [Willaertia magna]
MPENNDNNTNNIHKRNTYGESDESDEDLDYIKRRRREKYSSEEESEDDERTNLKKSVTASNKDKTKKKKTLSDSEVSDEEKRSPSSYRGYGGGYRGSSSRGSSYSSTRPSRGPYPPTTTTNVPTTTSTNTTTTNIPPKRKKYGFNENEDEEDLETTDSTNLKLIILLGEENPTDISTIKRITEVSTVLIDDLENDYTTHSSSITDIILQCVTDFPIKIPLYGTLVGLINTKIARFGEFIVQLTVEHIVQSHNHYDWIRVKTLLRFVCGLMNSKVISDSDVFTIYEHFIDWSIKYYDNIMGVNYMFLILGSLPWGIETLKKNDFYLKTIKERLTEYFDHYKKNTFSLYKAYKGQRDALLVMWEQFQSIIKEDSNISEIRILLKPYNQTTEITEEHIHRIELPIDLFKDAGSTEEDKSKGYIYKGRLGMYEELLSPDLDKLSDIDRLILEEYIVDLLYFFNGSHRECVSRLYKLAFDLTMKAYKEEKKGESPKTLEEKERAILEDSSISVSEYFEHVAIDVILGTMCLLPSPPVKIHFYNVVIIGLCMQKCNQGDNFSREIVEKYMNLLFERMDSFDIECCMSRFTSLMSYYLSHFDCKWDWNKWSYIFDNESSTPNKKRSHFIKLVLQKTFHVSYMNKVMRSIKGSSDLTADKFEDDHRDTKDEDLHNVPFAKFLPSEPEPNFKFNGTDDANKLVSAIKEKKDSNQLLELFNTLTANEDKEILLSLFLSCIMNICGTKNSINLIDFGDYITRYREVFKNLIEFDAIKQKVNIVKTVWTFWNKSPQRIILFLKKLLIDHELVNVQSVANYVLRHDTLLLEDYYAWDILKTCLDAQIIRGLRAYEYGDDKTSTSATTPKLKRKVFDDEEKKPEDKKENGNAMDTKEDDKVEERIYLDKVPRGTDAPIFHLLLQEIRESVCLIYTFLIDKLLDFSGTTTWDYNYIYGLFLEMMRMYQCYLKDLNSFIDLSITNSDNSLIKDEITTHLEAASFFRHVNVLAHGGFRATLPRYSRKFKPEEAINKLIVFDTRPSIHDTLLFHIHEQETNQPVAESIARREHPLQTLKLQ